MSDGRAYVYAYANDFVTPARVEVLFDWSDSERWPPMSGEECPPPCEPVTDPPDACGPSRVPNRRITLPDPIDFLLQIVDCPSVPKANGINSYTCDGGPPRVLYQLRSPSAAFLNHNAPDKVADFVTDVWCKTWTSAAARAYLPTLKHDGRGLAPSHYLSTGVRRECVAGATYRDLNRRNNSDAAPGAIREVSKAVVQYANVLREWLAFQEDHHRTRAVASSMDQVPGNLAELRRLCRDEPTLGYLFRVLHYVPIQNLVAEIIERLKAVASNAWLFAWPHERGAETPLEGFVPVPTLLLDAGTNRFLSDLATRTLPRSPRGVAGYFGRGVQVRQIRPRPVATSRDDIKVIPKDAGATPRRVVGAEPVDLVDGALKTRNLTHLVTRRSLLTASINLLQGRYLSESEITEGQAADPEVQRLTDAATSIIESRAPYDQIAITWDRADLSSIAKGEQDVQPWHRGFKGQRVDVRLLKGHTAGPWESLTEVERHALTPDGRRALDCIDSGGWESSRDREGHVFSGLQGRPGDKNSTTVLLTRDFTHWAGSSTVTADPLDRLARIPSTNGNRKSDQDSLSVRERPRNLAALTYNMCLQFRVRNVGLSGLSPLLGSLAADPSREGPPRFDPSDSSMIEFRRSTRMNAPDRTAIVWHHLERWQQERAASDIYSVNGGCPRFTFASRIPLAHWRVALHACGLTEEERRPLEYAEGGSEETTDRDFEEACFNFAARIARTTPGAIPYLSAVDPHAAGVILESYVWYPFSDDCLIDPEDGSVPLVDRRRRREDRYVKSGEQTRHERFCTERLLGRWKFRDHVIKAEHLIENELYPMDFSADVATSAGLKRPKPESSGPVLYRGFRNRLVGRGIWSPDADSVCIDWDEDGIPGEREWSESIVVVDRSRRTPLGGRVQLRPSNGRSYTKVTGRYAGLRTPDLERRLLPLPTPDQPTKTDDPPARATVHQWRQYVFDCADGTTPCPKTYPGTIDAYLTFIGRMFGGCATRTDNPADPTTVTVAVILTPELGAPSSNRRCDDPTSPGATICVAPAFSCPANVVVRENPSTALIEATVGTIKPERRLPFVDDDVTWVVRLNWRVPLRESHIERPRDLAGLKEFRLYRTQPGQSWAGEVPRAILPRPTEAILRKRHLDEIEFAWIDTVQDRSKQAFDYWVVAVPEYEDEFEAQAWFVFPVTLPSCTFDPKPQHATALPLTPLHREERGTLLYFRRDAFQKGDRLAVRVLTVEPDPLLSSPADAAARAALLELTEPAVDELFAGDASIPDMPPTYDLFPAEPYQGASGNEQWIFARSVFDPAGQDGPRAFAWSLDDTWAKGDPGARPFFKLQLAFYRNNDYPRLRHTAPSEILETDWLQTYPGDIEAPIFRRNGIEFPNGVANTSAGVLAYRFHFFATTEDRSSADRPTAGSAFHLSTFYGESPRLELNNGATSVVRSLSTALDRYIAPAVGRAELLVVAEEGLLATTYGTTAESGGEIETVFSEERTFVTLRGCRRALALQAERLQGGWAVKLVRSP